VPLRIEDAFFFLRVRVCSFDLVLLMALGGECECLCGPECDGIFFFPRNGFTCGDKTRTHKHAHLSKKKNYICVSALIKGAS
jgi:hypothetical protein